MSDEKVQNLYLNSLLAACALVFQLGGGGGGGGGGLSFSLLTTTQSSTSQAGGLGLSLICHFLCRLQFSKILPTVLCLFFRIKIQ